MANNEETHSAETSSQIVEQSQIEEQPQIPEQSQSRNNGSGRGKGVTVLLPSDVTVERSSGDVFIPCDKEMAKIKKTNGRFNNCIIITSGMSEKDVKKILLDKFDILSNQRFCCASADHQRRLEFHGERRVWDGGTIRRKIKGNSALYILIEHEGTSRESQPSTSGLTYQQMIIPSASESCIVPNSSDMVVSYPVSQQGKAGKRKVEKTAEQEKIGPSSGKRQKVNSGQVFERQMQPVVLVLQPGAATNLTQLSSRIVTQQTRNEVATTTPAQSEYSRNNTAGLGGSPQQTLPTSITVQNIPLQRGHLVPQQPSSKQITDMIATQGNSQQHCLPAPVAEQKENCKPPLQRGQQDKQSPLSRSLLAASPQGSSQPYPPLQPCAVPGKQGTVSEAATAPQNGLSQKKQPLFVKTGQEDFSAPPTYNKPVYRGKEILWRGSPKSLEHDRTAGKLTGLESLLQPSTIMSPSRKQENGTSSAALLGNQDCGQSAAENLTFQPMQHGFVQSATSTQKISLEIKGLASGQSVNEDSMTSPFPHHDQADLGDKATLWRSSSKQSMLPYVPQASQDSVKPLSIASGSQQWDLIDQTSEQEGICQQAPPAAAAAAAAAAHKDVSESISIQETTSPSIEKLSVNETKRERQPHDHNHQENLDLEQYIKQLVLDVMSNKDNLDLGYESTFPGESTDAEQSEDRCTVPVTDIIPREGSTKGGEQFCVILPCFVPFEIQSCVADFEGCGTVPLRASFSTLVGITPGSKSPGLVNVTIMSKDKSWMGGKTKFLYVDRYTREELLPLLVTDSEMQRNMFGYMHKGIVSDLQTSDPSGKALPGSSGANHSRHAQSVKLLQFLVYKAAQIGGDKFIQMIFNTSAGKVVFNNYKNNAKLPEHVARANGHKILAEYLEDVNNRLSEESNSDTGTETIDWLELKRAVDKEESLPCTDDAQMLKNCQPPSPISDYDGSDYLADDELSACSSPSHSELSDTEDEDHSQDTITYRSLKKEKEENLPVESLFPLDLVGNQLNVIPSIKTEDGAYEHKQLNSVEVETHSSEGNSMGMLFDELEAWTKRAIWFKSGAYNDYRGNGIETVRSVFGWNNSAELLQEEEIKFTSVVHNDYRRLLRNSREMLFYALEARTKPTREIKFTSGVYNNYRSNGIETVRSVFGWNDSAELLQEEEIKFTSVVHNDYRTLLGNSREMLLDALEARTKPTREIKFTSGVYNDNRWNIILPQSRHRRDTAIRFTSGVYDDYRGYSLGMLLNVVKAIVKSMREIVCRDFAQLKEIRYSLEMLLVAVKAIVTMRGIVCRDFAQLKEIRKLLRRGYSLEMFLDVVKAIVKFMREIDFRDFAQPKEIRKLLRRGYSLKMSLDAVEAIAIVLSWWTELQERWNLNNLRECLAMSTARISTSLLEMISLGRIVKEHTGARNREETLFDGIKATSSNLERMNSEPRVRELVERMQMAFQLRFCWLMVQGKTLLEIVADDLDGFIWETRFIMKLWERSHVFDHWLLHKWTGVKSLSVSSSTLYIEELGRARALVDLMATQYSMEREISCNPLSWTYIDEVIKKECNSTCLYISCHGQEAFLWILKPSGAISFRKITVENNGPSAKLATNLDAVFAIMANSMLSEGDCNDQSVHDIEPKPGSYQILTWCYKLLIDPVSALLEEPSIIIVPEGGLCLFPFAALLDDKSGKYLSETFRIRIAPSLKTLKLIQDSPADYHSQTGALVVGDPTVGEVIYRGSVSRKFVPLPGARKEAEMVGRLLGVQPLLGQYATKQAVLEMVMSASLIHIAAHGNAERGEIALAPLDPTAVIPQEDDYLLTVSDISQIQLRAKLVVLSCCHSGRGQIRSEEIIGLAGAFLGSGARSVLVALWALNDEATEQLMCRFYEHLVLGESASESLHQAMKWMRGNGFTKVSDWAPFTLIGDDVAFDFGKQKEEDLRKEDSI